MTYCLLGMVLGDTRLINGQHACRSLARVWHVMLTTYLTASKYGP